MASDCSPKELVVMLNELFGKFDQIAKVSTLAGAPLPFADGKGRSPLAWHPRGVLCAVLCQGGHRAARAEF